MHEGRVTHCSLHFEVQGCHGKHHATLASGKGCVCFVITSVVQGMWRARKKYLRVAVMYTYSMHFFP